jgi:hypothetical protein
VAVARRDTSIPTESAAHFDISVSMPKRWMAPAEIDDDVRDGLTTTG